MLLNLGCGVEHLESYVNIDADPNCRPDIVRDLRRGLPFGDGSIFGVRASHVLELIQDDADFFFVLYEVWRVLVPNGRFEIMVPPYDFEGAFSDPTHHRYFTPRTFDILCGDNGVWGLPAGMDFRFTVTRFVRTVSDKDPTAEEYRVVLTRRS